MRLVGCCRRLHGAREKGNPPHDADFALFAEPFQRRFGKICGARCGVLRQIRQFDLGIAENGLPAGVSVLDVEHRVLARVLDHLDQIEIKGGVVLAVEHVEAHRILADFLDHLAQSHELPCPLRHLHGLAGAEQAHELDELYVQHGFSAAHGLHRRLHALDVAAVIGAPHVDQIEKATVDLGFVIGDVGGEIGVAAVRFLQRPVDIVAELSGSKQGLLAVFPILDGAALGRRQAAFVDQAFGAQTFDR